MLPPPQYSNRSTVRTMSRSGRRRISPNRIDPFEPRTREQYRERSVAQLKEICRARGLKMSGRREELITRLMEYNNQH